MKKLVWFMGLVILGLMIFILNQSQDLADMKGLLDNNSEVLVKTKDLLDESLTNNQAVNEALESSIKMISDLREHINALEENDEDTLVQLANAHIKLDETQVLLESQLAFITNKNLLRIMDMNIDTYEPKIHHYLNGDKLDKINKLKLIADILSKQFFDEAAIEVLEIKEGIAYINIPDSENTWQGYFAGTTGGSYTATTLVESFLQRGVDIDDWIKGVKLTYQGQDYESDHIGTLFTKVHLRQE